MNCQDFAKIVVELARAQVAGKPMDAAQRTQGAAHAKECATCAARLADEHSLTAGLRMASSEDAQTAAPVRLEASLLAAFRQQQAAPAPVVAPAQKRQWPLWALAAAALVLLTVGLGLARMLTQNTAAEDALANLPRPLPGIVAPSPSFIPVASSVASETVRPETSGQVQPVASVSRRNVRRSLPLIIRDSMTLYASANEPANKEVVSDFYPLAYATNLPPLESGQLIRVQMPRSALVAYGLPVAAEHTDVPVKADLLVGEDGVTRAIRFVR